MRIQRFRPLLFLHENPDSIGPHPSPSLGRKGSQSADGARPLPAYAIDGDQYAERGTDNRATAAPP